MSSKSQPEHLRRELGLLGATLLGLGSILGTGVFVSIGISAGITGASVVVAIALAAVVAGLNGMSSAQLAAAHPVSGGTYEYGYQFLNPSLGFMAGWLFMLAKSASAATAALGFAGYFAKLVGWDSIPLVPIALIAIVAAVAVVSSGAKRSSAVNMGIVLVTISALATFIFGMASSVDTTNFRPFLAGDEGSMFGLFEATALMFVAYTGYGRIATLGEEVRDPERTIPRAIGSTLGVTVLLYIGVGIVAVGAVGAVGLASLTLGTSAPLEAIADQFDRPAIAAIVAVGAVTAMIGVLLNLVLGLSRVLMAMGRRHDVPGRVARLDASGKTPTVAVIVVGVVIAVLAATGDVRLTWTFSAFNVLVYYAITNGAAIRMPQELRRFPVAFAWAGLVSCLGLVVFIDWQVWLVGAGIIAIGFVWHAIARRSTT